MFGICEIVGVIRRLLWRGKSFMLFHFSLYQEFIGIGRGRLLKTFWRNGVLSKNYVKSGIFGKEYSKILTEAFQIRSESEYDDHYIISKEEVEIQIQNEQFFLNGIVGYINDILC